MEISAAKHSRNKQFLETADSLNARLPTALTVADVDKYPEFTKVLESLCQHLTVDGLSVSAQQDHTQAKKLLNQQKRRWLLNQTLYAELQELMIDHRVESAKTPSSTNSQFYATANDMLTYAEINDYIDCSREPGSSATLLGLTGDKLDELNPHKMHKQSIQQRLIPDVESRLRGRCEALAAFHDSPSSTSGDGRFDFAKACQLPAVIEAENESLVEEKNRLKKDVVDNRKLASRYRELLLESIDLLSRFLAEHRLKSQPEYDAINSEWLAARCDAMCLKIKVLELQLLYDTYYPETVQALTAIKSEVDKSIENTEKELERKTSALRAYEAVGIEFDSVVQEFTRLTAEVENRRWGLHELKKHPIDRTVGDCEQTFLS